MLRIVERGAIPKQSTGGYLLRAATNVARDRWRRAQRLEQVPVAVKTPACAEATAVSDLEAHRLSTLVLDLPPRQRAVFIARVLGYGPTEAARRLGITGKSAERALDKARTRLKYSVEATLALLARLYLGRRTPRAAINSNLIQVAAVGALIILSAALPTGAPVGGRSTDASLLWRSSRDAVRSATYQATVQHDAELSANGSSSQAHSRATSPSRWSSTTTRVSSVGSPQLVRVREVEVTRYDQHETFVQSLERCVANRPSLSPQALGCPPR
jgi:hypothetical protein